MIPATPLLEPSKVSIASTSILIRQTSLLITADLHKDPTNTTLLVTRVPRLMTLDSSTAHTFLSKWFVPLVRTPSSPRLASRPDMVLLLTHSLKALMLVTVFSPPTQTATTEELRFKTSCDSFHSCLRWGGAERHPFFI